MSIKYKKSTGGHTWQDLEDLLGRDQVSAAEITAGTETALRNYSPKDIADIVAAHEAAGGGSSIDNLGGMPYASLGIWDLFGGRELISTTGTASGRGFELTSSANYSWWNLSIGTGSTDRISIRNQRQILGQSALMSLEKFTIDYSKKIWVTGQYASNMNDVSKALFSISEEMGLNDDPGFYDFPHASIGLKFRGGNIYGATHDGTIEREVDLGAAPNKDTPGYNGVDQFLIYHDGPNGQTHFYNNFGGTPSSPTGSLVGPTGNISSQDKRGSYYFVLGNDSNIANTNAGLAFYRLRLMAQNTQVYIP